MTMTDKKRVRELCRYERKAATTGVGIDSPICLYIVMSLCIITDFATSLTSIEAVLTENYLISVLLAFVTAVALDGLAIPIMRSLKQYMRTRKPLYKVEAVISISAFILVYLLTVVVKVSGARDLFHVADLSISGLAAETQTDIPLTAAQISMVVFMAVIPLVTTLLAACICAHTVPTRVYRLKLQLHKLKISAAVSDARIEQYKRALAAPLEQRDIETRQRQIASLRAAVVAGKVDAYTEFVLSGAAATPEGLDLARSYAEKLVAGATPEPVPDPVPAGAETVQLDFSTAADRQAT